jgi:hypothetical protein
MMDPMADLDGPPQGGASSELANSKEVFDQVALQRNMQRIDKMRSVMGIASGCVSGIVGLTGLEGLGTCWHGSVMIYAVMQRSCVLIEPISVILFF